jgi:RNA polymerase sigma factor (sigma-70 family)
MKRTASRLAPPSFRSLFSDGVSTGLTDKELLERFATSRDSAGELAFATLVARHGPMVLSVCRRMLRDPHESEDAFQATFLVLVRKRSGLRIDASLGPWLYGVSVRVARRARDLASRRRWIELDESIAEPVREPNAASDPDLRFAIDDFLAELPPYYRSAIVLCYLEGLTHEEAANRLRCPVGTVRSRLARGRAILKERLHRAEIAPAVSPRAGAADPLERISPPAVVVAPKLADSIARTAARHAAGEPLVRIVPTRIVELVIGVTKTVSVFKLATSASLVVFTGLVAWGAAGLAAQTRGRATQEPPGATASSPETPTLALLATNDRASESEIAQTKDGDDADELSIPDDLPPVVLKVEPRVGATNVDPDLKEIRVTFSKKMTDKSWSWPTGNKYAAPKVEGGTIHFERDGRTCVMPVKLEAGKTYVIGVNSERYHGFKDAKGHAALPYLIVFRTKAAAGR